MTNGENSLQQRKANGAYANGNGNGHANGKANGKAANGDAAHDGGDDSDKAAGKLKGLHRVPTAPPPFTVADIRKAIPAHCFERSYITSFRYLFVDLAAVAALFWLSSFIEPTFTSARFGAIGAYVLRAAAWTVYWCIQGSVMTGLWVIGHECGHGGFSDSEMVNDSVGLVIHSLLLVPFYSWKISHRRHHSNTSNLERDEVFVPSVGAHPGVVPRSREIAEASKDEEGETGQWIMFTAQSLARTVYLALRIVLMLTLGWPLYLAMNATGHQSYPANASVNHFSPSSPIFTTERERRQVIVSDVALALVVGGLVYLSYHYTFLTVFVTYGIPYLITNMFLVLITFLQHTDTALPHYSGSEWDWLRGALATIDRDYGILNVLHHHIADTHVVHHLFSAMPHYHAEEATRAVKPLLGAYYRADMKTPITTALWQSFARCTFVSEDDERSIANAPTESTHKGVYWFQRGQYA